MVPLAVLAELTPMQLAKRLNGSICLDGPLLCAAIVARIDVDLVSVGGLGAGVVDTWSRRNAAGDLICAGRDWIG